MGEPQKNQIDALPLKPDMVGGAHGVADCSALDVCNWDATDTNNRTQSLISSRTINA